MRRRPPVVMWLLAGLSGVVLLVTWWVHAAALLAQIRLEAPASAPLAGILARRLLTNILSGWFACVILLTGWHYRATIGPWLARWLGHVDHPINLAVARILVYAVAWYWMPIAGALALRSLAVPPGLLVYPLGLQTIGPWLPRDAAIVTAAWSVFQVSAVGAIVGVATRVSVVVAGVAASYIWALTTLTGKVDHFSHHLVWFMLILACSRCGDALSVDARWTRRRPAPSVAYGFPLRVMWILVGMIYFFPGLWKLNGAGMDWMTADNIRHHLHVQWLQFPNWTPPFRLDRFDAALWAIGVGTILFELGFLVAVLWQRTRQAALAIGVGFHLGCAWFLRINFATLWLLYPIFLDWSWLDRRPRLGRPQPLTYPVVLVASVLLIGNVWLGARGIIEAWPLSCYPKFAWIGGPTTRSTQFVVARHSDPPEMWDRHRVMSRLGLPPNHWGPVTDAAYRDPSRWALIAFHLWDRMDDRAEVTTITIQAIQLWVSPERHGLGPIDPPITIAAWRPTDD